jgi:hypothetical protein
VCSLYFGIEGVREYDHLTSDFIHMIVICGLKCVSM